MAFFLILLSVKKTFIKLDLFRILIGMDKRFKLSFIILCFAISAFAQQFSVSGRVTDADVIRSTSLMFSLSLLAIR